MAKVDPDIQRAVDEYNSAYQDICSSGESLYNTRVKAAKTINDVEDLVNSIANHPKTFDTDIGEIKTNRLKFADAQRIAQEEFDNAKKGATGAIAGVGAGAAIAAAAPSAAMWFATTFGTASTGTAISALSGAAATNAALAWLGGGVIGVGSGMAGGSALLSFLAGPAGWIIGGATLLTTVAVTHKKKKELEEKKQRELRKIKEATTSAKTTRSKILQLHTQVAELYSPLVTKQYQLRQAAYGADYLSLDNDTQLALGALVNNTLSLSKKLSETIS